MGNSLKAKRYLLLSSVASMALLCAGHTAHAFDYQFDNGVDVRFDNTIQYSVTERTSPVDSYLGGQTGAAQNTNDGDDNLRAGIVSNRVDLLSLFGVTYGNYGFTASVDSFYDAVYNQKTQNTDNATYNAASQPASKFTSATETQAGRNIELRNLFVFGTQNIDGIPVTLRVGRFVNLYGESLLFAANGISYGQAPLDITRALSVPNTEAKNLFLPVGQALISAQLNNSISVSAYYQFQWQKYNFVPAGDFFSPADVLDEGGQRLYAATIAPYVSSANPGAAAYLYRASDINGSDTGQFGASAHFDPVGSSWDFGLYAIQYNDSEPQIYVHTTAGAPVVVSGTAPGSPLALAVGTYQAVYANGIQVYGASTSTTVGPLNLAGEISTRIHDDLNSSVTVLPGQIANNTSHPLYAIGDTLHYQASGIYLGPKTSFWDTSTVVGEVAGDNLYAITQNSENYDRATSKHMGFGVRAIASATYFEVLPGLDVTPNIGLGWNFMGQAPDTPAFNGTGIDRGGDLSLGISGIYANKWTGGISYTRYIAPPQRDPFADKDFVSFNVERTF